jgi:hypothetical protein
MKIGAIRQFLKHFESLPGKVETGTYKARIYFGKEDYYVVMRSYYDKSVIHENGVVEIYQTDGDYILFEAVSIYKIEIIRPGG